MNELKNFDQLKAMADRGVELAKTAIPVVESGCVYRIDVHPYMSHKSITLMVKDRTSPAQKVVLDKFSDHTVSELFEAMNKGVFDRDIVNYDQMMTEKTMKKLEKQSAHSEFELRRTGKIK